YRATWYRSFSSPDASRPTPDARRPTPDARRPTPDAVTPVPRSRTPVPLIPLPRLLAALDDRGIAILQAPPGAGKTTRVPPALLGARWLGERKILMLEPRRLAARAAAAYMARRMGERIGETVGYRVRMDTRIGP